MPGLGRTAVATSYVPMADEALVDQAPVIAVVEVLGSNPGQDGARPFTGYRVRVEKVLKGAMASAFPADRLQPAIGTVSFSAGQTRSNNTLLLLATTEKTFLVFPSVTGNGSVHMVVDVNGYFE